MNRLTGYAVAVLVVAVVAGIRFAADSVLHERHVYDAFLIGVAFLAWRYGWRPAFLATILSALTVDYLFYEPRYVFDLYRGHELPAFLSFMILAGIMALLATQGRRALARATTLEELARRREEEFRASFELNAAGIVHVTPEGKFEKVNRRFCQMLLYPEAELLTKTINDVVPAEDHSDCEQAFRTLLSTAEPLVMEKRYLRKDGEAVWTQLHAIGLRDKKGQVYRILGAIVDVTAHKRAEADLAQAREAAERLVERRTAELRRSLNETELLCYSMAHDLRAPLRAMQSFAHILQADYSNELTDPAKDLARRIERASNDMSSLITDLLNYSQVRCGERHLQPVNIDECLTQVLHDCRDEIQHTHATVTAERGLPEVVADSRLLRQSLSNLLFNALKFVRPGVAPVVNIYGYVTADSLHLCIEDNGIGISEKYFHKVFGIFERLDKRYPGTGIGLAVVKKAVEQMHGNVGLTSEEGRGTTFWIDLPLAHSPATT